MLLKEFSLIFPQKKAAPALKLCDLNIV